MGGREGTGTVSSVSSRFKREGTGNSFNKEEDWDKRVAVY